MDVWLPALRADNTLQSTTHALFGAFKVEVGFSRSIRPWSPQFRVVRARIGCAIRWSCPRFCPGQYPTRACSENDLKSNGSASSEDNYPPGQGHKMFRQEPEPFRREWSVEPQSLVPATPEPKRTVAEPTLRNVTCFNARRAVAISFHFTSTAASLWTTSDSISRAWQAFSFARRACSRTCEGKDAGIPKLEA